MAIFGLATALATTPFFFLDSEENLSASLTVFSHTKEALDPPHAEGEVLVVFKDETIVSSVPKNTSFFANMFGDTNEEDTLKIDEDILQKIKGKLSEDTKIDLKIPKQMQIEQGIFEGVTVHSLVTEKNITAHIKSENQTTEELLTAFDNDPTIEFAQPNYLYTFGDLEIGKEGTFEVATIGNAEGPNNLWGIYNNTADAGVRANEVWADGFTGEGVVVAVIDSGVDDQHPDLAANMWTNPGEIPGNGVDDDGNGFIDDIHGWDFFHENNDSSPVPNEPQGSEALRGQWIHGTHVAGTIAALQNNNGVVGVAPNAQIMALKVFPDQEVGFSDTSIIGDAVDYAMNNGADVVNMSLGAALFNTQDFILQDTIQTMTNGRSPFYVAATGNNGNPFISFPSSDPAILAVGSSTNQKLRANYSNFGTGLDVLSPGGDGVPGTGADPGKILSTAPNNQYAYLHGTSMASPNASGVVALMISKNPGISHDQIFSTIRDNAEDLSTAGWDTQTGFGFLDAKTVIDAMDAGTENPPGTGTGGGDCDCPSGKPRVVSLMSGFGQNSDEVDHFPVSVDQGESMNSIVTKVNDVLSTIPNDDCGLYIAGFSAGAQAALEIGLMGQEYNNQATRIFDGIIHINKGYGPAGASIPDTIGDLETGWAELGYQKVPIFILHDSSIDGQTVDGGMNTGEIQNLITLLENHGYADGNGYKYTELSAGHVDFSSAHADYANESFPVFSWMENLVSCSANNQCTADADCSTGESCVNGACFSGSGDACALDTDCATGESCIAGTCINQSTNPSTTGALYLTPLSQNVSVGQNINTFTATGGDGTYIFEVKNTSGSPNINKQACPGGTIKTCTLLPAEAAGIATLTVTSGDRTAEANIIVGAPDITLTPAFQEIITGSESPVPIQVRGGYSYEFELDDGGTGMTLQNCPNIQSSNPSYSETCSLSSATAQGMATLTVRSGGTEMIAQIRVNPTQIIVLPGTTQSKQVNEDIEPILVKGGVGYSFQIDDGGTGISLVGCEDRGDISVTTPVMCGLSSATESGTATITITDPNGGGVQVVNIVVQSRDNTLRVSKSADKDSVFTGEEITYTITCENTGDIPYEDLTIVDDYNEEKIDIISVGTGCSNAEGVLTCEIGQLPGNAQCPEISYTARAKGVIPKIYDAPLGTDIPGNWTGWSHIEGYPDGFGGTCSRPCGGGIQFRTCTNPPPSGNGADCSELDGGFDKQSCNTQACPGDEDGGLHESAFSGCVFVNGTTAMGCQLCTGGNCSNITASYTETQESLEYGPYLP